MDKQQLWYQQLARSPEQSPLLSLLWSQVRPPHLTVLITSLLLLMLLSLSWLEYYSGTFDLCVCVLHIFENYVSFLLLVVISLLILYINTRTCMTEGKQSSREATNFGEINCGKKKKVQSERNSKISSR